MVEFLREKKVELFSPLKTQPSCFHRGMGGERLVIRNRIGGKVASKRH
jgi:hypothetical protein